jgi:uncharacterized hydrophobic protein (TIGR00271 family)
VNETNQPTSAANASNSFSSVIKSLREWWHDEVTGEIDQAAVIEKRRQDCALSERYLFMTAMSAGIAVIGLLQSSTAVVIGAMLLSPLMGPIMGLGFALAIGDFNWLKQSVRSLAWGSVIAIALCAFLVFFSPIKTITLEIAARTQPNLFDLFVALFSGMAGAYAMIRGRADTIVGVAIATALMPPLAVVGFGLASWNWTVFSGAFLLFITNLVTIALTAWGLAKLYGFRTSLSQRQTQAQNFIVIVVFLILVVPLALSLNKIVWETNAQRIVREEITEEFQNAGRLSELEIGFSRTPIPIDATMLTPSLRPDAEKAILAALENRLGRKVELTLTQFQVGTSKTAAEQAELSKAKANEEAAAVQRAQVLAGRLALVAGVEDKDVTIDTQRKRATVRARPLDGASMAAYRVLEERIAKTMPDWTIELIPPMAAIPSTLGFDEDGLSPNGARALSTIEWAATRTDRAVIITGPNDQVSLITEMLGKSGVNVTTRSGPAPVRAEWGE